MKCERNLRVGVPEAAEADAYHRGEDRWMRGGSWAPGHCAAAELLPAALNGRSAIAISIGFGLGTVAMLLIAHFSEGSEGGDEEPLSPALPGRREMSLPRATRWAWW